MITNSKPQADQARLEGPSMLETPGSVDLCIDGKLETWLRNGRLRISHETPPPSHYLADTKVLRSHFR